MKTEQTTKKWITPSVCALTGAVAIVAAALGVASKNDPKNTALENDRGSQVRVSRASQPTLATSNLQKYRSTSGGATKTPGEQAAELAAQGESAIPELSQALADTFTPEEQQIYADALALIGSEAAVGQILARALEQEYAPDRRQILESLSALSNRDGLPALTDAFTQRDRSVVRAAQETISRLGDASTVDLLVERYRNDPSVRTQRGAITSSIAGLRDPEVARTLASLARTAPEPGLVEAAARSLSKIGSTTAAQGLQDALVSLGDRDPNLSHALQDLISRVTEPEGQRLLSMQPTHSAE